MRGVCCSLPRLGISRVKEPQEFIHVSMTYAFMDIRVVCRSKYVSHVDVSFHGAILKTRGVGGAQPLLRRRQGNARQRRSVVCLQQHHPHGAGLPLHLGDPVRVSLLSLFPPPSSLDVYLGTPSIIQLGRHGDGIRGIIAAPYPLV